ncbi:hypothetical protein ACFORK_01635 [Paenibacillus sp. GCM10012306]
MKVIISIGMSLLSGFFSWYGLVGYLLNTGGTFIASNEKAMALYIGVLVVSLLGFILTLLLSKMYLYCTSSFVFSLVLVLMYVSF